jgi:hypothetical protein
MTLNTAQPHYQTLGQFDPDAALRQGTAITHPEEIKAAYSRIEELERALKCIDLLVDLQANDEGLWFIDPTCAEAYVQAGLRKLHSEIETRVAEVL